MYLPMEGLTRIVRWVCRSRLHRVLGGFQVWRFMEAVGTNYVCLALASDMFVFLWPRGRAVRAFYMCAAAFCAISHT